MNVGSPDKWIFLIFMCVGQYKNGCDYSNDVARRDYSWIVLFFIGEVKGRLIQVVIQIFLSLMWEFLLKFDE